MYCPQCKTEYLETTRACADCGAWLRPGAPERDERRAPDLVPVFITADIALLAVVTSALEAAEIPFVVQGEGGLRLFPLGPFALGVHRPVLGARILVLPEHADDATKFLESFEAQADPPPGFEGQDGLE